MILGQVLGSLVSVRKHDKLTGSKFLLIQPFQAPNEQVIVAVDTVGAGAGDQVIVVQGSSARRAISSEHSIVDAVVVGIVDQIHIEQDNGHGDSQ